MLERIKNEPALIGGAITAILNALVLLDVLALSVEQITGLNVAVAAVLAVFVRSQVTPTAHLEDEGGAVDVGTAILIVALLLILLVLLGVIR